MCEGAGYTHMYCAKESFGSPGAGVCTIMSSPIWVLETELGSCTGALHTLSQYTEPSLQKHHRFLKQCGTDCEREVYGACAGGVVVVQLPSSNVPSHFGVEKNY